LPAVLLHDAGMPGVGQLRRDDMTSTSFDPEVGLTTTAAGFETNYHDCGSGDPVVLVHGSGAGVTAWANWRGLIPELEGRHRVIAPDMAGFGYTNFPDDFRFEPQAWVHHLVTFLDAVGVQKASFVGNSFGGAVALWTAMEHPDRVDRLVLMGSAGLSFPMTEALDAVWGYEPSLANMSRLLDYFLYDRSIVPDDLAELRYRASMRPGVQETFRRMFPPPRQRGLDGLTLPESAVRNLQHRTLIIHGREDQVVPLESSLRMHALIPNSELHVFGKCGHWTQIERAADFAQLVAAFLAKP
jgi:2-hydroxymuconate-semialdehyde hydrolase